MAVNETQFKAELRALSRKLGIQSVANNPEWNKGIPDLYLKCDAFPGIFLELKWSYGVPRNALCGLTALQAKWIRDHREVLGYAATLIGWKSGPVEWSCGLHWGADEKEPVKLAKVWIRKRGLDWPLVKILFEVKEWHTAQMMKNYTATLPPQY